MKRIASMFFVMVAIASATIQHGPTFPPNPWDKVQHGPTFPPNPWDKVAL